jgi:hypothetical protein
VRTLLAIAVTGFLVAACGASTSSAGPPDDTSICGTNLGQNWNGAIYDLTGKHQTPGTTASNIFSGEFIRVSDSCDHGGQVTWTPRSATHVLKVAKAADGLPVVMVFATADHHKPFTVTAKTGGQVVGSLTVN